MPNQLHNIKNPLKSRIYEQIAKYLTADNSVVHNSNANDMRVTHDLNSFGEIV
jgi:gamma-glutamyl phosphate reductase